jgi:hypothetical protein
MREGGVLGIRGGRSCRLMNSLAEGRLLADTRLCGLAQHETQERRRVRGSGAKAPVRKDIFVLGSAGLPATLMQHGLFDEYRYRRCRNLNWWNFRKSAASLMSCSDRTYCPAIWRVSRAPMYGNTNFRASVSVPSRVRRWSCGLAPLDLRARALKRFWGLHSESG